MNKLRLKYQKLLQDYSNEVTEAAYPYSEKADQYPEKHPFEDAPAEILDDEEFMLDCFELDDAESFKFCSYRLRDNKDFVMKVLKYSYVEYENIGDSLKKDFDIIKKKGVKDISYFSHDILRNERKLIEIIKNSHSKNFVSTNFLSIHGVNKSKSFFYALVGSSNGEICFKWADKSLKSDFKFIEKCISLNPKIIKFVNKNIPKFEKLILKAISKDGEVLKYVGKRNLSKKNYILISSKTFPEIYQYINKKLRTDKQIALSCILKDPKMIKFSDKKIKQNKKIILKLLYKDISFFKYIDKKLKIDRDILKSLISNLKFHDDEYKPAASYLVKLGDRELIKFAIKKDGFWLDHLSKKYKDDKEIATLAIKNYYGHFKDISNRLKEDKEILEIASKQYLKDKRNNINDVEKNNIMDRKLYWYIFYKVNPKAQNGKIEKVEGIEIMPEGIFDNYDKVYYDGFIMNSRPHGKGYATNEDSEWGDAAFPSTYEGMWENGRPHGQGEHKQFKANHYPPNGKTDRHYIGSFKNGLKHGKGKELLYRVEDGKTKWRKVEYKKGELITFKN